MVDVTYQEEKYSEALWEEFWPLLEKHKEEISTVGEDVPLQPVREVYDQLDEAGALKIASCRVGGHLVGYVVLFLSPHLHYASVLGAQQDVFFLLPEYRRGYTGRDLLRFAEEMAKSYGAQYIRQNIKPDKRDFSVLLRREKYREAEVVHEKRLV